ncbi:hypothetical protein CDAR_12811 [Caerostris darwini]|uniref:Ribosomal protein S14 n=1 Tax=Caerostris darwini TaxID=1538125 RepID=A0AAV4N9A7_9ARAC|nr:hypothetical protein CDAR_12811 [Caerostris darwini]
MKIEFEKKKSQKEIKKFKRRTLKRREKNLKKKSQKEIKKSCFGWMPWISICLFDTLAGVRTLYFSSVALKDSVFFFNEAFRQGVIAPDELSLLRKDRPTLSGIKGAMS